MADSPDLGAALKLMTARRELYTLYNRYYRGNHRLAFATDKFRSTFGSLFAEFADNLCKAVISATANRLVFQGFGLDTDPDDEQPVSDDQAAKAKTAIKRIWKRNRMKRKMGAVHTEALNTGDAYVIVEADDAGKAVIHPNRADQVVVTYDPERPGVVKFAAKFWAESDGRIRANLYYVDRIERYVTDAGAKGQLPDKPTRFVEFVDDQGDGILKLSGTVVPVFHFANDAGIGELGYSELADVIPLQDALNKSIADMLVAMEFAAMPQRWVTGMEVEYDPDTGLPKNDFTPGIDRIWALANDAARFGEFQTANLMQFLAVQNDQRTEIARIAQIPLHTLMLMTGDFPSGESLKTAETPATAKTVDRMDAFGETWCDVAAYCVWLETGKVYTYSADWVNPTPVSQKEKLEGLQIKQTLGIPEETLWSEMDYTAQEIETMAGQRDAGDAQLALSAAVRAQRAQAAGGDAISTLPQ